MNFMLDVKKVFSKKYVCTPENIADACKITEINNPFTTLQMKMLYSKKTTHKIITVIHDLRKIEKHGLPCVLSLFAQTL